MKDSFSRAAFNYVEKNVNLRQYNGLPPKNMLVAFCDNSAKKALDRAEVFDASFDCYATQAFLLFASFISEISMFWGANDMEEKANDKSVLLFEVTLSEAYILHWKRRGKPVLPIALRRSVG